MKIIIYALGKIFEKNIERICMQDVVAFADNKIHKDAINGKKVIQPQNLKILEYDYIVIFTDLYYEKIKNELTGQYFIQEQKIISWRCYVGDSLNNISSVARFFTDYISENEYRLILDMEMDALSSIVLAKEELFRVQGAVLDRLGDSPSYLNEGLYDNLYSDISEVSFQYELVLIGQRKAMMNGQIEKIVPIANQILISASYKQDGELETLLRSFDTKRFSTKYGVFWIINCEKKRKLENCRIYVVTHKDYNVKNNELYIPLCVGSYQKDGFLTEQNGEHITHLNNKINECTALYWVWKNSAAEYVGLNHYRRYFYKNNIKNSNNLLDNETIYDLMQQYDIILPKCIPMDGITEFQQIESSINEKLFRAGYELIIEGIQKHQPQYVDAFFAVMNGSNAFLCNMFVTNREILGQYCEWLFSFLIEVTEKIDINGYDNYSQRVIGFFAERMWTVWLRKQRLKIKELPYDIV